jgi:ketosteroid isomerase-like protein
MSGENVELVRRAYEAFNRSDIDGVVADLAPDC